MASDSQRGYLSGILQRGARTSSPTAPTNPVRPFMPCPVPFLDPISSEFPAEIETFREPTHPQKSPGSEPAGEQPKTPAQVLSPESERQQTTNPPEPTNSRQAAAPDDRAVFSSPPPARPGAATALSPISAGLKPAERSQWGGRLPRLIRTDVDEVRGNSINQAVRTKNLDGDQQALAQPATRVDSSAGQNTQIASSVRAASHQGANPTETVNSRNDRSPKVKRIESSDAKVTSLLVQNSQTSQVVVLQSLQPEQDKSTPTAVVPVFSGGSNQLAEPPGLGADPIEQSREVVVEHIAPGQREQSVIWSPSPAPRDDFSGGRQQSPPTPRPESPKLTINQLDVQIVNQSVPPVVQRPPPAPAPQLDGWENLERYHLGHLDLIF